MAQFNAAERVSELSYDFRPYVQLDGVVPEPSSDQIRAFKHSFSEMVTAAVGDVAGAQEASPLQQFEIFVQYLGRDTAEIDEKGLHAMADVCSNKPSFDDLTSAPYRIQQAFLGWLVGLFLVPEGLRLATNR
jgi:hypothetical protein